MAVNSSTCNFGWKAPDFALLGTDKNIYSLADIRGPKGTLIMFICNHCPYVKAIAARLSADTKTLKQIDIGVIAIMANDPKQNAEDSFENMSTFAQNHGFTFPYVIDETQDVARAYDAVCTPDFFGFNQDLELQYRGRLDDSGRVASSGNSRRELVEAMVKISETGKGPTEQIPSMGCSIKWSPQ
ncbi:MAG: thioredoxin family protein [Magnetovibrio sp.]|nr:thioredoxin family protein [Magnetovibrio sp.]